jgi:hypothetical protein
MSDYPQPMPGLSKRAQELLKPRSYGQMPPKSTPRYQGEIPRAFRSKKQ